MASAYWLKVDTKSILTLKVNTGRDDVWIFVNLYMATLSES